MRIRRTKLDLYSIENSTYLAQQHRASIIERAARIQTKTPENGYCCMCATNSRIGGAMCCSQQCSICDTVMRFGSTCTDAVCPPCGEKHKLCRKCGGDIDLKQHRKRVLPEILPNLPEVES